MIGAIDPLEAEIDDMSRFAVRTATFIAVIIMGVGLSLFLLSIYTDPRVEVPARIIESEVVQQLAEHSDSNGEYPELYEAKILYKYFRNGKWYSSDRIQDTYSIYRDEAKAREWVEKYPAGAETYAYVMSNNYRDARLHYEPGERDSKLAPETLAWLVITGFGFLMFVLRSGYGDRTKIRKRIEAVAADPVPDGLARIEKFTNIGIKTVGGSPTIRSGWNRETGVGALIFVLFLYVPMSTGVLIVSDIEGVWKVLVAPLPVVLPMTYLTLAYLFNSTEVISGSREICVRQYPFPLNRQWRIEKSRVYNVYAFQFRTASRYSKKPATNVRLVTIDGDNHVLFKNLKTPAQGMCLVRELEKLIGLQHRPVPGAIALTGGAEAE